MHYTWQNCRSFEPAVFALRLWICGTGALVNGIADFWCQIFQVLRCQPSCRLFAKTKNGEVMARSLCLIEMELTFSSDVRIFRTFEIVRWSVVPQSQKVCALFFFFEQTKRKSVLDWDEVYWTVVSCFFGYNLKCWICGPESSSMCQTACGFFIF